MPIIHDGKNIVDRLHGGAPLVKKYHGDRLVWSKHIEARLPLAYQEVEYLQADGRQYINLNLLPSVEHSFTTKVKITDKSIANNMIIGSRTSGTFQTSDDQIYMNWQKVDKRIVLRNRYMANVIYFDEGVDGFFDLRSVQNENCQLTTVTQPYFLFALNKLGTPDALASCQVYNFTIYDNSGVVMNLVPCYRKSDHKAGMYDTISDTFFTSVTNADFFVGADVKCNKLEFIENPNSNFIDLKLKMNSAYSTEIDYQYNKYTVGFLFGSRSSNTDRTNPSADANKAYSVLLGTTKENFDVCNVFSSAARYQQDYNSNRRKIRINKEGLWIDGNKKKSFNKDAFTTVNNAFMFSCPYCLIGDTKTVGFVDAKVYSLTIKDATNVLKMNLIPYKIGDNTGLLDTVSKVFFIGELVGKPFATKEPRRR